MEKWKQFEIDCCEYLNDTYGSANLEFVHAGFSDSTAPDIICKMSNGSSLNIEAKSAVSQCGQFVVSNKDDKFIFSSKNKSDASIASEIIEYMNDNYTQFVNATTAGEPIALPNQILWNWVKKYYQAKGTKFFITKGQEGYVICETEQIDKYFDISSTYRIKRSGTGDVPKKDADNVRELFDGNSSVYIGKKLHIKSDACHEIKTSRHIGDYDYFLSEENENGYYIRRQSNTFGVNVIFSISLISNQEPEDLQKFKDAIK
ncbi:MAG: hypothetical protein R3Y32_05220 [Bacillota bacterium]